MRVLIVEDDLRLARTLRRGLQEAGFSVDLAQDGDEAMAATQAAQFDLIVLDVMLPIKDGIAVCTELRRVRIRTPILMLTSRDAVADRIRGLEAGADDYLVKPPQLAESVSAHTSPMRGRFSQILSSFAECSTISSTMQCATRQAAAMSA